MWLKPETDNLTLSHSRDCETNTTIQFLGECEKEAKGTRALLLKSRRGLSLVCELVGSGAPSLG